MKQRYECEVGFSDHTFGYAAPISAAFIGATIIEKHFTFSRLMYGSDAKFAMEPTEFRLLSKEIRSAWTLAKSKLDKDDLDRFSEYKLVFQKSIVASKNLIEGTRLSLDDLAFKKPGSGICASNFNELIGKTINKTINKDEQIRYGDIE